MRYLLEHKRRFWVVGIDAAISTAAYVGAYLIRFEGEIPHSYFWMMVSVLPLLVLIRTGCFLGFGLYRGVWAHASVRDLLAIVKASLTGSVLFLIALFFLQIRGHSRAILLIDLVLVIMLVGASRLSLRLYREVKPVHRTKLQPVLVIGAGDAGEQVVREIRQNPKLKYHPVGFLDDDPGKQGLQIHGVSILGALAEVKEIAQRKGVEEVIIAIPSADRRRMREIFDACQQAGLTMKTVPGLGNLLAGTARVSELREIRLEDLLPREPARLDVSLTRQFFAGKRVLVTGAGGSIGSEICRQVAVCDPAVLVLVERGETPLFEIDAELGAVFPDLQKVPVIADIKHATKLDEVFAGTRPEIVLNAAAFKHVPLMELCPEEAILNNIVGTRRLAEAAVRHGVGLFLQISTDKAVNPTNVMGATKRAVERYLQSLAAEGGSGQWSEVSDQRSEPQNHRASEIKSQLSEVSSQKLDLTTDHRTLIPPSPTHHAPLTTHSTTFCAVRFGNVLGSSGSVVPTFRRQIERGGPVTVTHPEITRFFMTIPEAVQLVLRAATLARGGEIFVLDMGTPVKIADLARDLIRLSGLEPDRDIAVAFTGLRPGEKLTEELWYPEEAVSPTEQDKLLVVRSQTSEVRSQRSELTTDHRSLTTDSTAPGSAPARSTDPHVDPLTKLLHQLDELERLAQSGAPRAVLLAALQSLAPEYTPAP